MALSTEIKERIFAAADTLYAASETGEFPSVETVRQESHAGMNNVVEAMKKWRENQRKHIQTTHNPLPVEMNNALHNMGQSLWDTAQQLANESLDAVKIAFESEKDDLTQISVEQSEAYEAQATELERAEKRMADLEKALIAAETQIETSGSVISELRDEFRTAQEVGRVAEQRAEEIGRRVTDLRTELDRCHTDADKAQKRQEQIETERDEARASASVAREEAAVLHGQLEAIKGQNADLLTLLKNTGKGGKARYDSQ